MPGRSCAFRGCRSKGGEGITFFGFPKDPERAKIWINACFRTDLLLKVALLFKSFKLCELHFEKYLILEKGKRKFLAPNALPTLFLKRIRDIEEGTTEEPPKKVVILSDVIIAAPLDAQSKSSPFIEPHHSKPDSEQPFLKTYFSGPSTSKDTVCDPLVLSQSELQKTPPLTSSTFCSQTPLHLSSNSPRKKKLKDKVRILKQTMARNKVLKKKQHDCTVEEFCKLCDVFLDEPLAEIIKTNVDLKKKKRISHRYSMELKQFALTLYFLSPRAYHYLRQMLTLPTKRSLERLTKRLTCKPGLENTSIFKALEIKVRTMLEQDKRVILCIDEVSLKSNLTYCPGTDEIVGFEDIGNRNSSTVICKNALVIMARGLYSSWKQPLAFFFVGSQLKVKDLKPILEKCIHKLSDIGLNVEGISSDMGTNFIQLANAFGVTPNNPEFQVGERSCLYIFDPCHLIKATRNNLLKHTFHFDGKETRWSHIEKFYNIEKEQFYRCAPKLTNAHLNPSNFEKMKVSLASQILSNSVACGMNTHIAVGALPPEAVATAEVVERFNNLFDIVNSCSLRNPAKFKNVFDGSTFQVEFLDNTLGFLDQLRVTNKQNEDITNKTKFITCWKITINSLKKLWEKLSTLGYRYLKTRRLNTDCIENFFGSIRQQSGNNVNPTPIQFQRAFRKLFCQNYMHSHNMNCNNDLDKVLIDLRSTKLMTNIIDQRSQMKPVTALTLPDYDYRTKSIPTQNAFTYVCGYIVKRALDIHNNCYNCQLFGRQCQELDINNLLSTFKGFDNGKGIFGGLQSPPEDFINYIYQLENIFISNFEEICSENFQISHNLFNLMNPVEFNYPCPRFPKDFVLKLFIRMRIFYTIKYFNRELKDDKKNIRKLNILSHI